MNDRTRDERTNDDEIDIQMTPVDDEFAVAAHQSRSTPAPVATLPRPDRTPRRSTRTASTPSDVQPATTNARRSVIRLYFEALVSTLVIWLFGVTFLFQPVEVPTESMLNTILVGDHLLVNRFVFGTPGWLAPLLPYRALERGDVVVFRHPIEPQNLYVKRVVGLPGETVEIYGTRVYIDGKELPETKALVKETSGENAMEIDGEPRPADDATYTVYYSQLRDLGDDDDTEMATLASVDRGTFAVGKPFTIPDGEYFCLGDNRDNSEDSRFWGTVPRENVVGRAMFVYWSFDGTAGPSGLFRAIRWDRIGTLLQ